MRALGLAALMIAAIMSEPVSAQEAEAAGPIVFLNTHETLAMYGTVPADGAVRTAWVWTLWRRRQQAQGMSYDAIAAWREIDCAGGRQRTLKSEVYLGTSYLGTDPTVIDWRVPGTGTLGASAVELMCRPLTSPAWEGTYPDRHAARRMAETVWAFEHPENGAPSGD